MADTLTLLNNNLFILFTFLFMGTAAFFTCSEIALISANRSHLQKLQKQGNKSASIALILLENIESLLTTTQFGTNLSIASATTFATLYSILQIGDDNWYTIAIITPTILLFCDSFPKIIARSYPETIGLKVSYPLLIISSIFSPFTKLLSLYTKKISALAGGPLDTLTIRKKAREQLYTLLGDTKGEIKLTQKRMIQNILEFSQQNARKAMIPLVKVDAIESTATIKEAIEMFENLRHSNIPIYEERVDNIIGMLNFIDLFSCKNLEATVTEYMSPAIYVSEHQQLETLLIEITSKGASMAIVVNEYGGATGMITKEDVLEEVVGNLSDEFDENTLSFHQISERSFLSNVNIEIADLNERLGSSIPKGEYETLSGFLLQQFNRIPEVGDELYYSNLKFKVYRSTKKAIQIVIISKL